MVILGCIFCLVFKMFILMELSAKALIDLWLNFTPFKNFEVWKRLKRLFIQSLPQQWIELDLDWDFWNDPYPWTESLMSRLCLARWQTKNIVILNGDYGNTSSKNHWIQFFSVEKLVTFCDKNPWHSCNIQMFHISTPVPFSIFNVKNGNQWIKSLQTFNPKDQKSNPPQGRKIFLPKF